MKHNASMFYRLIYIGISILLYVAILLFATYGYLRHVQAINDVEPGENNVRIDQDGTRC